MPFNCDECDKEVLALWYLSEYGRRSRGTKDDGEYCQACFDVKFEEKNNDKNDKE